MQVHCLIGTSYLVGLFAFSYYLCFSDVLPMRTHCDAYHKEFESH